MSNIDVEFYALKIRRLASAHQSGMELKIAKTEADLILNSLKARFVQEGVAQDKCMQAQIWKRLLNSLKRYINSQIHPAWLTIIRYTSRQVRARIRSLAIHADLT